MLAVFAPALLHFGATSADAVYLTLGLLAAITLLGRRPWLGALVLAVVSLFAWSLLAIAAWAAVLILARDGLRPAVRFAALTGVILLAFHALFALATGFDPLGTLHATSRVYEVGIASRRPYAYWLFGSPTAFLLILGAPIFWLALKSLANRSPEALAIAAVIAFSCVLGFTKAETERIWLFYAPLVILAAAPLVRRPQLLAGALADAGRDLRAALRHPVVNELRATPGQQPHVDPQRPALDVGVVEAVRFLGRAEPTLRRTGQPRRHQPPRAGVARAGPRRQRARADEAQLPPQDREQQRELARAHVLERAPEGTTRELAEAREGDRPAVAPETLALLDPAAVAGEQP